MRSEICYCWYCNEDRGPMVYCKEFDTFVHEACVRQAAKDPNDQEAQIIANEVLGEKEKLSLSESPQPEYCDCQGFHDGSCHARRIETLEQLCVDLDEALADKKQFLDFSNNVAAYDHLIANEIDQERIKLLECLRANYMDDNK